MAKPNPFAVTADQLVDMVPVFHHAKRTPLFVGRPGIAKTAFVREAAVELTFKSQCKIDVREMHLASMSEVDVRGYLIPHGDKAVFTQPEFWGAVERNPGGGILFLDEFPQATHEVQKAVAPLILERRIGDYQLPDNWSVMLAGNGLDDGAGANSLLSHIVNRVSIVEVKAPDPVVWASWAVKAGLPPEIAAFSQLRPDVVFESEIPAAADTPYCTPRSIHAVGDLANSFPGGIRSMVDSKLGMAMMQGAIGTGATAELSALIRTAINLPSYEQVVSKPDDTMIPDKADMQYAMIMLLACRAKVEDSSPVLKYLTRMKPNLAVTGIVSLVRRDRMFASSPVMHGWVMQNKELLAKFARYITDAC